MAIYRTTGDRRLAISAAIALVVGLVGGFAIGRVTAPGLAAQLADARAQAAPIATSLVVVRSEYPKLLAGGADPGGAAGALARVRTTFDALGPTLQALDSGAAAEATSALEALEAGVAGKAPEADVDARIDAFAADLAATLGVPVPTT